MKEYTIIALISVVATMMLDKRSAINLLRKREFIVFLAIILFFKLLVNGFLTSHDIVMYDGRFHLGWRIGSIPIEDFLFGFSMVTLTILSWEFFKAREKRGHTP